MASKLPNNGYILGLDVGEKRIGVAIAGVIARLPQPVAMIPAGSDAINKIRDLIKQEDIKVIIVGMPRNLQGAETAQSEVVRNFATQLAGQIDIPVEFADESLSSVRAEDLRLQNDFKNVNSDSLAACFILEEYFTANVQTETGII